MKRVLLAAMLATALSATTGCRVVDTVLLGKPCVGGRGPCGPICDPCAGGSVGGGGCCGDSCGGCGDACGTTCHSCPLYEVFGLFHPDRMLCAWEYDSCDGGCGDRYWGDFYRGQRAGCESCDCHGNWSGHDEHYIPGHGHVIEGHPSQPTPAEAAPKPPKPTPGPANGTMSRRNPSARSYQNQATVVPARATRSRQPAPRLQPVGTDSEWTARRGR
jgi:hypothetical protein